jgi:hypothetical protein
VARIEALLGEGFTFAEIEAMTLPQIIFATSGPKAFRTPKFESFDDFAIWRRDR